MTIPTTGGGEKPKEAQVLINPETMVKVEFKAQRDAVVKQQHRVHSAINELIQQRRRRYLAVNIAVAIASLLVVVAGICGGIYVYKWITHTNRVSMQGSCTVPYHENPQLQALAQRRLSGPNDERRKFYPPSFYPHDGSGRGPFAPRGQFIEKYNILNSEQEVLQVPQFGASAFTMPTINIVHDFRAKLTAIVDASSARCFVKPLDPKVVPPRDFIDVLRGVGDGTYVPNVCFIRKQYRAQQPPLNSEDLAALGSDIISRLCSEASTYQLVKIDSTTTALPEILPTTPSTLPNGDEEYDDHDTRSIEEVEREQKNKDDDEDGEELGAEILATATPVRAKRSVDQVASSTEGLDFNVGFDGTDFVELAHIEF